VGKTSVSPSYWPDRGRGGRVKKGRRMKANKTSVPLSCPNVVPNGGSEVKKRKPEREKRGKKKRGKEALVLPPFNAPLAVRRRRKGRNEKGKKKKKERKGGSVSCLHDRLFPNEVKKGGGKLFRTIFYPREGKRKKKRGGEGKRRKGNHASAARGTCPGAHQK